MLFLNLDHAEVYNGEEATTLATSVQTHIRLNLPKPAPLFATESITPYLGDVPRWRVPPGAVWLQLLAFRFLDPAETPLGTYVATARFASATMGLLTVAAVFWVGMSLGGRRVATFAALALVTCPGFLLQARLASPPAYYAAWHMLSLAAGLWALRPLRPHPSIVRQALGWSICGLGMGLAILTAGPGAAVSIVLTVVLFIILCPSRLSHLMGLLAALLLAGLTVLPWATYAHLQDPQAWPVDWRLWFPPEWLELSVFLPGIAHRALLLLLALAPWTLWLVGALIQPFSTSSAGGRLRLFLAWGWFLLAGCILLGSATHGSASCLIVAVAVGAVFIGQLFDQYADLAAQGRFPRLWRVLRWPHVALTVMLTLFAGLLLGAQPWLLAKGFLPYPVVEPSVIYPSKLYSPGVLYAAAAGAVLLAILGMSVRWAWQQFPGKAMLAWSFWGLALTLILLSPLTRGPLVRSSGKQEAGTLAALVRDKPIFWLSIQAQSTGRERALYDRLDPTLVFYLDKPLIPLEPGALRQAADERGDLYILTHAGVAPMPERMTRVPAFRHETLWLFHLAGGEQ